MEEKINLNDIADDLLILNRKTVETLFQLDNCADCAILYLFYYKTAKWQKTNIVRAVDYYVKKCLHWGDSKLAKAKQILKEHGLISVVQRRKAGKIEGWYVEVRYLVSKNQTSEIEVLADTSNNPQIQGLVDSRSGFQRTNALINNNNKCFKITTQMLKENKLLCDNNKLKSKKFNKPSLEEVEAYCKERNNQVDPESFIDYYEANGWKVGRNTMKDWRAAVRTWERREKESTPPYRNARPNTRAVAKAQSDDDRYEPSPDEDIRDWSEFFDMWEQTLGMRPTQTVGNVAAARQLRQEVSAEHLEAMLVALALRGDTGYITREIKNIATPKDLLSHREQVWAFYQEHRQDWQWKYGRGNKEPWEL